MEIELEAQSGVIEILESLAEERKGKKELGKNRWNCSLSLFSFHLSTFIKFTIFSERKWLLPAKKRSRFRGRLSMWVC